MADTFMRTDSMTLSAPQGVREHHEAMAGEAQEGMQKARGLPKTKTGTIAGRKAGIQAAVGRKGR